MSVIFCLSFWHYFFIGSGIIFWILMAFGAFMWWATGDFEGPVDYIEKK